MMALDVREVTFQYDSGATAVIALDSVSFQVEQGDILSVLGPSGCGKSTLIRLLAGLSFPKSGEILENGKPITGPSPSRAVVFQQGGLFPWLSARGNVALAIEKSNPGLNKYRCRALAEEALVRVGLQEFIHSRPAQLSGGMIQRVALAKAIFSQADLLLLDEPFSALDPFHRRALQDLLLLLWAERRRTVVFVTHDIDEAILLGGHILFLEPRRSGQILAVPFSRPRERESVLTSAACCSMRKKFISMFNRYGEAVGECL